MGFAHADETRRSREAELYVGKFILGFICAGAIAQASQEYKLIYLNSGFKQIEATQALLEATKGNEVYKCQTVSAKVGKTGTSISLKQNKKPKVEKE